MKDVKDEIIEIVNDIIDSVMLNVEVVGVRDINGDAYVEINENEVEKIIKSAVKSIKEVIKK